MAPAIYIINAEGKRLGRVAVEAANALRGKNLPTYRRDRTPGVSVRIEHVDKLAIDARKFRGKEYKRYSGYPGGLKTERLETLMERRGSAELVRLAIYGMLPRNRSRAVLMKRIVITK